MSRPERWWRPSTTRRPAARSRARIRQTHASREELDQAVELSMEVGVMEGRKQGERDAYMELARLLDDPDELFARISGRALAEQTDTFLLVAGALDQDPERFARLADALDEGDDAVTELLDEWGIGECDTDEEGDEA
ncbi:hypothetical protein [Micromonospora carbonacea]|uniref:Uncharacterized protein n=1 Tax=Micromonospora carbonacea TaxID=47853 RepID=A0A7H8XIF8_9ACTN|nr:hypothetical protein [Micromonospora carbonacea]MBB5828156.1 hypothetical protein [Micromonospora carbonacea]QLD24199.1 hypothetical protein HXZ27_08205 [Micromonospora carbonacea]